MTGRQSANGQAPRGTRPPPPDWAVHYEPTGAPPLTCDRRGCGAKYLDDGPGRQAHIAVFGHSPRPREPAEPAESTEGEST